MKILNAALTTIVEASPFFGGARSDRNTEVGTAVLRFSQASSYFQKNEFVARKIITSQTYFNRQSDADETVDRNLSFFIFTID